MKLRYIPNIITITRMILLIPFLHSLLNEQYKLAFYLFFFAGLTDGLDGWIARHFNWQSQIGGMLDPISDKLFVSSSFITLGLLEQLPWWVVFLVLIRDAIIIAGVSAYRYFIGPLVFHSTRLSKWNTVLQGMVIFISIYQLAFTALPTAVFWSLVYGMSATTLASCLHYIWLGTTMAYRQTHSARE